MNLSPEELTRLASESIPDSVLNKMLKEPHLRNFVRILVYMNLQSAYGAKEGIEQGAHFAHSLGMYLKNFSCTNTIQVQINSTVASAQ